MSSDIGPDTPMKFCQNCQNLMRKDLDTCPACRARQTRPHILRNIIIALVLFLVLRAACTTPNRPSIPVTRQDRIEQQFSSWDGSHIELERVILDHMNDPSSYEHDETVYWDKDTYLIVKTSFRGKNAFGGVVRNWVKAKVDLNGKILKIIEWGP